MKALETIGWQKALRFVWYGIYGQLLHWCLIPQIRVVLMRLAGARIGSDTIILDGTFSNLYHYGFSRLTIGKKCFIGEEVMLDCRGFITLGDHVTLSNRVTLVTHINVGYTDHPLQSVYPTKEERISIEPGAYVGTGAILLPGVRIGKVSVIAAGAVVIHDVRPGTVVAGVPAKKIKKI